MSSDSFMQPEIYRGEYYSVETTNGTEIVPLDVSGEVKTADELTDYLEGRLYGYLVADDNMEPQTIERSEGWLARMSAPGHLDCTPWIAYGSYREALEALAEDYDSEEARDLIAQDEEADKADKYYSEKYNF